MFIHLHKAVLNDDDDHDDMTLLFNTELKKCKNIKVKIHGFAELMVPKFTDREFKSHLRLNRQSVKVCFNVNWQLFVGMLFVNHFKMCMI